MRVEVIRKKGEGPVIIRNIGEGKDGEKHIEILTETVTPGVVTIHKKVNGKDVIEKRVQVGRKGGKGATSQTWTFSGSDDEDVILEDFNPDIHIPDVHIPPIHIPEIRLRRHPGKVHEGDRQAEIRALQEALKSIQSRLDQLQKTAPLTPMAPLPPIAPVPPPPPPPAPEPPPAPPAPPAHP
jgi:hypothetical protein